MSRRLSSEESDIWLNSAFEFVPTESNEPSMVDIDHSIDAYFTLNEIVSLVGKVISSNDVLCTVGGLLGKNIYAGKHRVCSSPLAKSLVICIEKIHYLDYFKDKFELHPYVELMIDISKDKSLVNDLNILEIMGPDFVKRKVNAINGIVERIRAEAKTSKLLKSVQNYQRTAKKNYQSGRRYLNSLFRKHAKLLVMRIDLSYKKGIEVDIDTVRKDREMLFTSARSNPIFKDMLGYVWKLEYGLSKGYHYHVMFIFDGSKVWADVNYAKRIGQFWADDITEKNGLYYNCNATKMRYQCCGIGLISYRDNEKQIGLDAALKYMTLRDKFIKVKTGRVMRSFGKGCVVDPAPSTRGRPRSRG